MSASKADSVPSVERALTVLELLTQSRKGFSISEVSRKLSLPKSSVHLILTTLERRGYLQKHSHTGKYHFGLKLVSLSRTAIESLELREEARPFLETLMRKTGLTVHMAVLERNEAVIIEKIQPLSLIQLATWIGRRMDVNCTGAGKALIAYLPPDEFDLEIKSKGLAKHNHKTIVSLNKLRQELSRIREQGYAFDDEEDEIGLRCIGAPVFDNSEKVVASISVSGTTVQITMERVPALARTVKRIAASISSQIGYTKL
jgi:DNA-binding IclR family transcriptional regulator